MKMTDKDDAYLEGLFDASRRADDTVSDALMARVLADAAPLRRAVPRPFWTGILDAMGGWPALGGVAAAGLAGVWLGLAPPVAVETFAADVFGTTTSVAFFSDVDDFALEGG